MSYRKKSNLVIAKKDNTMKLNTVNHRHNEIKSNTLFVDVPTFKTVAE